MFHKCKSREESANLYERISKLLFEEKDLLLLLDEVYQRDVKTISIVFFDDGKGKYRRTNQNLHDDDWRVTELFEEMVHYKNTHPEFHGDEFLNSVMRFCADREFVTEKQYNKLLEIYYLNNMQNMEAFS